MGTQSAIEHPSRNLQPSSGVRAVKRATENDAPRPLDHRVDADIAPKPRMKAIQNFSPSHPVGVLIISFVVQHGTPAHEPRQAYPNGVCNPPTRGQNQNGLHL